MMLVVACRRRMLRLVRREARPDSTATVGLCAFLKCTAVEKRCQRRHEHGVESQLLAHGVAQDLLAEQKLVVIVVVASVRLELGNVALKEDGPSLS